MTVANWTERVKPALNSRHFALILMPIALLIANGISFVVFNNISDEVAFLSNKLIIYLSIHSLVVFCLMLSMVARLWQWRLEQLGIVGVLGFLCFLNLFLCSYLGIASYSSAPVEAKTLMWLVLIVYFCWFSWEKVIRPYTTIWNNKNYFDSIFEEKNDHFIFYQLNEVALREKAGFKQSAPPILIIIFISIAFCSFFFRVYLTNYFGVSWLLVAYAIMALPVATIAVSFIVACTQYFYIARRILKQTGKPVYINNISKSKSGLSKAVPVVN